MSIRDAMYIRSAELIGSEPAAPSNPFPPHAMRFDYARIHPKYWAAPEPDMPVVLYKGAVAGQRQFLSRALTRGLPEHVMEVKDIIESGEDGLIRELADLHTDYYSLTALLSATFDPQRAQVFAGITRYGGPEKTIYQLTLPANRCIVDAHDTGGCYASRELLILGAIYPEEITSVKIKNDGSHSELLEGHWILPQPPPESTNRVVKDPTNWNPPIIQ